MNAFDFAAPTSVEDAVKLLGGQDSEALSGGTDLLGRMKDYVTSPQRVVYLKDVKALAGISGDAGSRPDHRRGDARWPTSSPARRSASRYPALWQSTLEVGTPQIRNMATLGGNLLQRPRCWYFRAGNGLLAMKDGKSLVRERRQPLPRDLHDRRRRPLRQPVEPGRAADRPRGEGDDRRPEGRADHPGRGPVPGAQDREGPRADARPRRDR